MGFNGLGFMGFVHFFGILEPTEASTNLQKRQQLTTNDVTNKRMPKH